MLDFTDRAVIQTGWGRLAAVVLAYLAATLSILLLQRWVARRVLFCLLVGMILHLGLGLILRDQYLEAIAERIEEARKMFDEGDDLVVVPDYHIWQIVPREEPLSFAQPVEVEPPRESQPTAIEKVLVDTMRPNGHCRSRCWQSSLPPIQPDKADLAVPHRGESERFRSAGKRSPTGWRQGRRCPSRPLPPRPKIRRWFCRRTRPRPSSEPSSLWARLGRARRWAVRWLPSCQARHSRSREAARRRQFRSGRPPDRPASR